MGFERLWPKRVGVEAVYDGKRFRRTVSWFATQLCYVRVGCQRASLDGLLRTCPQTRSALDRLTRTDSCVAGLP